MPLVTCPDCEHRISDAAPLCVHCGRPTGVSLVRSQTPEVRIAGPVVAVSAPSMHDCPRCGSGDVRKLSAIYRDGTREVEGGIVGVGLGTVMAANASGVTRSLAALGAAPPQPRRPDDWVVVATLGAMIALVSLLGPVEVAVLGVLCGVGLAAFALIARRGAQMFNKLDYPRLAARYERSYRCLRCDTAFQVAD